MSDPKNEPAFPCPMGGDWPECDRGMTLRDYFAAKALQGMLAYSPEISAKGDWHNNSNPPDVANMAYVYADAMMKAREA